MDSAHCHVESRSGQHGELHCLLLVVSVDYLCSIHVFEWADEVGKASGLTSVPSDTYSYLIMFHDIVFAI